MTETLNLSNWEPATPEDLKMAGIAAPTEQAPEPAALDLSRWAPATAAEVEQAHRATQLRDVDMQTGASAKARFDVALAKTPEDKLSTAQQYYPGARYMTIGGETLVHGIPRSQGPLEQIMVFDEGEKTIAFDPEGLEMGDVAEAGPTGVKMAVSIPPLLLGGPIAGPAMAALSSKAADLVMRKARGKVQESRSLGEQVLADVTDVGLEFGLGWGGGALGSKLGKARGAAKTTRKYQKITDDDVAALGKPEVLRDLQEAGIPLEGAAAMVTESPRVRGFYDALQKHPEAAETMVKSVKKTMEGIQSYGKRVTERLGPVLEKETVGENLLAALKQRKKYGTMAQEVKENALDEAVGKTTIVPMRRTIGFLNEKLERMGQGPIAPTPGVKKATIPKEFQDFFDEIKTNQGGLFWEQVRDYRGWVGEQIEKGKGGIYDQMYSKLTRDLEATAHIGGKGAVNAWKETQIHWAAEAARRKSLGRITSATNPEDAFRLAISGAKDGPTKLKTLKESITKDSDTAWVWDEFRSRYLYEAALETKGDAAGLDKVFSPARFISNWRDLPKGTRDILVDPFTELRKEYDRLARITGALKESGAMKNYSGTAAMNVFLGHVGGGGLETLMNPITAAGGAGAIARAGMLRTGLSGVRGAYRWAKGGMSPKAQAKLMGNAKFVRWLGNGQKIDPKDLGKVSEHLGRLSGVTAADPTIRGAVIEYLETWPDASKAAILSAPQKPQPVIEPERGDAEIFTGS